MLETTVELLGGLCLSALTVLIGFCIVGSIVAALEAVSRGSATVSTRREVLGFGAEVTVGDERNRDIPTEAKCPEEMQHG